MAMSARGGVTLIGEKQSRANLMSFSASQAYLIAYTVLVSDFIRVSVVSFRVWALRIGFVRRATVRP